MIWDQLLKTAILPACAVLMMGLLQPTRGTARSPVRDWPAALGLVLALGAVLIGVAGFIGFPPRLVSHRLPYLAAAVWLVALVLLQFKGRVHLVIGWLAPAPLLWANLAPLAGRVEGFWMWMALIWLGWSLLWWSWDVNRKAANPPEWWLFLTVCAAGLSVVVALGGSVLLGQLAGALAAGCGALFLLQVLLPARAHGSLTTGVFLTAWGCLWLNACYYVQVKPLVLALLLLSLCPIWLTRTAAWAVWPTWRRALTACGMSLFLTAGAAVYLIFTAPSDPYGY